MSDFELFERDPGAFFLNLLISLALTLFVYCLFPIIFAKARQNPITKKKYLILCYAINFIGFVIFTAINCDAISAGPYILWTWIFSKMGVKSLCDNDLLLENEKTETNKKSLSNTVNNTQKPTQATPDVNTKDKVCFCRKCGSKLTPDSLFCNKCGTKIQ